jgi:hypothetical protein
MATNPNQPSQDLTTPSPQRAHSRRSRTPPNPTAKPSPTAKPQTATHSRAARATARNLPTLDMHHQLRATGTHLSLIAHITQRELTQSFQHHQAHNGFANRCLWTNSKPRRHLRKMSNQPSRSFSRIPRGSAGRGLNSLFSHKVHSLFSEPSHTRKP